MRKENGSSAVATTAVAAATTAATAALSARRRSLFWRIHFWSAVISSPFVLVAALTGILYIFMPQIEAVLYARLDHVTPAGTMLPLDEAVAAARAAAPAGLTLRSILPAFGAGDSVKVMLVPERIKKIGHEGHNHHQSGVAPSVSGDLINAKPLLASTFYVNPYTAEVIGSLANEDRFSNWAKDLHSSLLQGDSWRWMIELAASAMLVMLFSGVVLWWPRGGANPQRALPQAGARGRIAWKQWHGFMGVALCAISLVILTTGLTWSRYAGDQIRAARDMAGQAPPKMPRGLRSTVPEGAADTARLSWQTVWDIARRNAPDRPLQLAVPGDMEGVLRVTVPDRGQPTKRVDMAFDAYSGRLLYFAGWEKQTAFSKATAVGIPFHRGEFGWWNQALLLAFGAGVLFSLVSGWVMCLKRWRAGSRWLPPLLPGAWKSAGLPACAAAIVLCLGLPVLAVAVVMVLTGELLAAYVRRGQGDLTA